MTKPLTLVSVVLLLAVGAWSALYGTYVPSPEFEISSAGASDAFQKMDLNPELYPPLVMEGILADIEVPVIYGNTLYLPIQKLGDWSFTSKSGATMSISTSELADGKCQTNVSYTTKWKNMKNPLEGGFTAEETGKCNSDIDVMNLVANAIEKLAKKVYDYANVLNNAATVVEDFVAVKALTLAYQELRGTTTTILELILKTVKSR